MKLKIIIYFFIGFFIGAVFWLVYPAIVLGHEPWYYSLSLLIYWSVISIIGFILGILAGKHFWAGLIGLYIGQVFVPLFRPEQQVAESIPTYIGLLVMAILSSPSIFAAFFGWGAKVLLGYLLD